MANIWDALKKTAEGFTEGYKEKRLAETKMKSTLETGMLLAKMKSMWGVEEDKQKKQNMNPYEQMMMDEYKKGAPGQGNNAIPSAGPTEVVPTATGFTTRRVGLKDMAERVYLKPQETWTPQDKQIVSRYQAMRQAFSTKGGNAPLFATDNPTEMPTEQPPAQPGQQPQFNFPGEADSSGLPSGTIVLVGGKRYQI